MKNSAWLGPVLCGHLLGSLFNTAAFAAAPVGSPRLEPLDDSRFAVKFKSRRYDPETNRTRFRYRVNPDGPSDGIRFVIGYGACGDVHVELDPETPERIDEIRTDHLDAETGIYGVEWTSRLRRWRGTPFSFELVGDIPLGNVRVAVHEGDAIVAGLVPGPNCSSLPARAPYGR